VFGTDVIGTTGLVGAGTNHLIFTNAMGQLSMSNNVAVGGYQILIGAASVVIFDSNNIGTVQQYVSLFASDRKLSLIELNRDGGSSWNDACSTSHPRHFM